MTSLGLVLIAYHTRLVRLILASSGSRLELLNGTFTRRHATADEYLPDAQEEDLQVPSSGSDIFLIPLLLLPHPEHLALEDIRRSNTFSLNDGMPDPRKNQKLRQELSTHPNRLAAD